MIGLYLKIYRWWMRWPQKIRFLSVGGYNTVFSYLLFASLLWLFNGQYEQLVLALSFAISSINSFWTQKIYVFGSKAPAWPEFVKCLGTWGISYGLNAALLWGFVDGIGIDAYIAQIIILVILTIFSWIMLKHFAFRNKIEKTL